MKIGVITGASSGLGEEFALQIAKKAKGLDEIWLIARRKERLEALKDQLKVPCQVLVMDLLEEKSFLDYERKLKEERPQICLLVNNAGFGKIGPFENTALQESLNMIDLNIKALVKMTYASLPYMKEKAKIIQLASSAAFLPQPYFNIYAATKAFVLSFSRSLSYELKEKGISVTAVCPGPVKTEFFQVASHSKKPTLPIKNMVLAPADEVVKKALKDVARGREISVYGLTMNGFRILSKWVPHRFILPYIKY